MSRSLGYIDAGDRVIIKSDVRKGTLFGQHGVVTDNDGWGRCTVRLDEGGQVTVMNGQDLIYEDEPERLPQAPVHHYGIV